jgi:hypothetical protein
MYSIQCIFHPSPVFYCVFSSNQPILSAWRWRELWRHSESSDICPRSLQKILFVLGRCKPTETYRLGLPSYTVHTRRSYCITSYGGAVAQAVGAGETGAAKWWDFGAWSNPHLTPLTWNENKSVSDWVSREIHRKTEMLRAFQNREGSLQVFHENHGVTSQDHCFCWWYSCSLICAYSSFLASNSPQNLLLMSPVFGSDDCITVCH